MNHCMSFVLLYLTGVPEVDNDTSSDCDKMVLITFVVERKTVNTFTKLLRIKTNIMVFLRFPRAII